MKYVLIQGDGMSDFPVESLGGLTPLERARTPNMDRLARGGRLGLARTIPDGFPAGTDVGTMTILGYAPARYHTGRSPIEAASMGIDLSDTDVAFRCNLVNIGEEGGERIMRDFTAGHITSEEAKEIIESIQDELGGGDVDFHPGVSYRHCMVWHGGPVGTRTTPPHDITDQVVTPHLPDGEGGDEMARLAREARELLAGHPVNARRRAKGEKPATDIWLWGQGRRPAVPTLAERFGLRGALITAVDVVGGLGRLAGLTRIDVPGITGFIDTNYVGKGTYALDALADHDFVFIHVESTDETGHMGDAALKVQAIEDLDAKVIGTVLDGIGRYGDYRILVLPDHATPVSTKTHAADPVPFAIFDSRSTRGSGRCYNENEAARTGDMVDDGHTLLEQFLTAGPP
jgi:2,3-bisphosphoglycerate-independent phosphoglycerate mutase